MASEKKSGDNTPKGKASKGNAPSTPLDNLKRLIAKLRQRYALKDPSDLVAPLPYKDAPSKGTDHESVGRRWQSALSEAVSRRIRGDEWEYQGERGYWRTTKGGDRIFIPKGGGEPLGAHPATLKALRRRKNRRRVPPGAVGKGLVLSSAARMRRALKELQAEERPDSAPAASRRLAKIGKLLASVRRAGKAVTGTKLVQDILKMFLDASGILDSILHADLMKIGLSRRATPPQEEPEKEASKTFLDLEKALARVLKGKPSSPEAAAKLLQDLYFLFGKVNGAFVAEKITAVEVKRLTIALDDRIHTVRAIVKGA